MHTHIAASPFFIQQCGNDLQPFLIGATIADQHNILEAVDAKAACGVLGDLDKVFFRQRNGAGEQHVPTGRVNLALRHISQHRRHQRCSEAACDLFRRMFDDEIMLAQHHVRPILLGAAGGEDDGGFARLNRVAQFHPGKFFDEYGINRLR